MGILKLTIILLYNLLLYIVLVFSQVNKAKTFLIILSQILPSKVKLLLYILME